jgi:hypothetical protein
MKGQAFLSLIFLIGAIVALAGITLAFFANSFVDTGYGYQASTQAEAIATSGAEDGLLQLNRYGSTAPASYTLPVGSSTATVTITQGSPSAGYATILSIATITSHTKKIDVVATVNASTSKVSVVSWTEIQ